MSENKKVAHLIIDGKSVAASNGATFTRVNPLSGKAVTQAAAASIEDANGPVHYPF